MNSVNNDKCKHLHKVNVTLNGEKKKINTGTYIVNDLKVLLGVPSDYELDIVDAGQLTPLPDNDEITICGHEEFVSHVKCGGSS